MYYYYKFWYDDGEFRSYKTGRAMKIEPESYLRDLYPSCEIEFQHWDSFDYPDGPEVTAIVYDKGRDIEDRIRYWFYRH